MKIETIYTICLGDENGYAVPTNEAYKYLEDAIQEVKNRNERKIVYGLISVEDIYGLWKQDRGEDISNLLTISVINKDVAKIAEIAKKELGHEMSEFDIINEVIKDCLERETLPYKWYGVIEGHLICEEEV